MRAAGSFRFVDAEAEITDRGRLFQFYRIERVRCNSFLGFGGTAPVCICALKLSGMRLSLFSFFRSITQNILESVVNLI